MIYYVKFKTSDGYKVDQFNSKRELVKHLKNYVVANNIVFYDSLERSIWKKILINDFHNINMRQYNKVFENNTKMDYKVYRSFNDLKQDLVIK